jgi:putative ABC transport system permease protein
VSNADIMHAPPDLLPGTLDVADPISYGVSVLVIMAACLLAECIPAARAARLDPMQTLRQE